MIYFAHVTVTMRLRIELLILDTFGGSLLTMSLLLAKQLILCLQLLVNFHQLKTLRFLLFQLSLADLKLSIDTGYFTLFLIKYSRKLLFEFALSLLLILKHLLPELLLFFVHVLNLFVEHLNVQLELLFDLYMITHVSLVLLQLLFVFLGRKFDRFEC